MVVLPIYFPSVNPSGAPHASAQISVFSCQGTRRGSVETAALIICCISSALLHHLPAALLFFYLSDYQWNLNPLNCKHLNSFNSFNFGTHSSDTVLPSPYGYPLQYFHQFPPLIRSIHLHTPHNLLDFVYKIWYDRICCETARYFAKIGDFLLSLSLLEHVFI